MNSQKYTKLTDIEHCLLRPARYLGTCTEQTLSEYVLQEGQFVKQEVTYNPAIIKMFDEIVTNSADESKRKGSKLNSIWIKVHQNTGVFQVKDNGGIPVEIHKEHQQWIPDMIFSELRSGSNFDDSEEQSLSGQNGEGSSLVNVFSSKFQVTTADSKNMFEITYENNLSTRHDPITLPCSKHYTIIEWLPDYTRLATSLTNDTMLMIEKRVYELAACNPRLKIYYNGNLIKINFKAFVELFHSSAYFDMQKRFSVACSASNGGFEHISYVNGTASRLGGTHVAFVTDQIVKAIREHLKKKHKVDVKPMDIKSQLKVFISCDIVNPRYDSQTKDHLVTDVKEYKVELYNASAAFISDICSSEIIQTILDWIAAKQRKEELLELRREQKKQKSKTVDDYIHANHKMRNKCILTLCEGASALSNFLTVCDRQIHGAFPLKGKPMNTRESKAVDIIKNAEISSILSILGLKFGEPATNLNYGRIRIMTDADTDGASIQGLLLNLFYYWPELYEKKMIEIVLAPIIIARKGSKIKRYYYLEDYVQDQDKLEGWATSYYKGLGSMNEDEYSLLVHDPVKIVVGIDNNTDSMLDVVYGKDASKRKEWLNGAS